MSDFLSKNFLQMLTDQEFSHKPIIWLGPEMFFHRDSDVLEMEVCLSFRENEKLHAAYDFHLARLACDRRRELLLEPVVTFINVIEFPDIPTPQSHRLWRFGCRTVFCIYSPLLAAQYRHRSSSVLPDATPFDAYTAFKELCDY